MSIDLPTIHYLHLPRHKTFQQLSSVSQLSCTHCRDAFFSCALQTVARCPCCIQTEKPGVRCRSKLDAAVECAPLFSQGHPVFVTVSAMEAFNLQMMSTVPHRWAVILIVFLPQPCCLSFFTLCAKPQANGISMRKTHNSISQFRHSFSHLRMYQRTYTSSGGVLKKSYR